MTGTPQADAVCYRHPNRPATLRCTRCERPICVDDAIDAPVGYLCPECARQPKHVQRAQRRVRGAASAQGTTTLLVIIGVVFLGQLALPELLFRGGLVGGAIGPDGSLIGVAAGEWWRIVTSGFLHSRNFLHIAFNAYLLYQLGNMMEPGIGTNRFVAVFFAGLFGGSAGALLLNWGALTIGASGAVFGLMGAAMVLMHRRGINPMQTGIGTLVALNLVITFLVPSVSIGGHLGGLIGGALVALPMRGRTQDGAAAWVIAAALGGLALFAGVAGPFF